MVTRTAHPSYLRRGWLQRLLAAMGLGALTAAHAATPLMIWPVDPVIAGPQRAVALWLENRGSTPVSMQVRVFRWSQADGQDQFTQQQQVVASPPISHIPPGQRQMVRLITTQPTPAREEQAYRVLVDELPGAPKAAESDATSIGAAAVRLQIRYAIPLFVYGPNTLPYRLADARTLVDGTAVLEPQLTWKLTRQDNADRLVVSNQGASHARITFLGWSQAQHDVLSYVLPHSQVRLELPAPPPQEQSLKATVNGRSAQLPRAPQ